MRRALPQKLLILSLGLWIAACSTTKVPPKIVPEPSPLDPKNPPTVEIGGLKADDLIAANAPLVLKYTVKNYPLKEGWQKIAFRVNSEAPLYQYVEKGTVTITDGLKKGPNILRVYLLRSWDESIKSPSAYLAIPFFYTDRAGLSPMAAKLPVLTLVGPHGKYVGEAGKKVLFDFLVQEFPARADKVYKLRYSLNGTQRDLPAGKAVYFENLPSGKYTLRVDVLNKKGFPLLQDLTHEESTFEVKEPAAKSD